MNSQDFSSKNINETALYVLKTIADGHLETDYVPIDKSLLQQVGFDTFCKTLRDDAYVKDDKLSIEDKKRIHAEKQVAVRDYLNGLKQSHPELFDTNVNYCKELSAAWADFHGLSMQWFDKPVEYTDKYSPLFSIPSKQYGRVDYGAGSIEQLLKTFFEAYFIEKAYGECGVNSSIKTYSHRRACWKDPIYPLNYDLSVGVYTNFGYGNSTYFLVKLVYKGIDIVPYSRLVLYRYANAAQLLYCTREYYPVNENWELALNFVKNACNSLLDNGSEAFVTKNMKNECEELTKRLAEYMTAKTFTISENLESSDRYLWEKEQAQKRVVKLNGYPLTIFRGSKVAGALDFVDSIRSLDELFPTEGYIATIRRCAEIVLPQLEHDLKRLAVYITQQEKLLDERQADKDKSQAHLDEVKPTYERHVNIPEKPEGWDVICEEYHKRKKAYDEICDACNQIANDISLHQRYKNQIEEHYEKIRRHLQD